SGLAKAGRSWASCRRARSRAARPSCARATCSPSTRTASPRARTRPARCGARSAWSRRWPGSAHSPRASWCGPSSPRCGRSRGRAAPRTTSRCWLQGGVETYRSRADTLAVRLRRASDIPVSERDRVFRHSRAAAIACVLVLVHVVGALLWAGTVRHFVLAYYLVGVAALGALVLKRFVLARFRSSNWLVRLGD